MSIFQKRELSSGGGTEPTLPRAAVCFTTSAMTRRAADWLARLRGCRPLSILSDHGEEVFDYAHRNGRIHDATLSPDCCRHQYEIPFMIWMSDRYRAARPELAAAIARAVDRPYMTDDLPHLLLDLAGLLPLVRPDAQRRQRPFRCLAPPIAARRQGGLRPHHAAGEGQCGNEQGCLIHSQTPLSISLRNRRIARRRSIFPPRRNGSPRPNAVWVRTTSSWAA